VLFAGDAFDTAKPTPTEQAAFRAGLDVLADRGDILMVAIVGNHDIPRAPGRTHALAIFEGYRRIVAVVERPQVVTLKGTAIACLPWISRAHVAAQDPEFEKLSLDEQNARIVDLTLAVLRKLGAEAEGASGPLGCVLLAHGSIAGSAIGAQGSTQFLREPVLPVSELRGLPFRLQCWGHLHRCQELDDRTRYSGSIERTDFAEADEDKGWWWHELSIDESDGGTSLISSWRSSNPRPFVDLDLPDPTTWETTLSSLNGDASGAVVRVRYQATPEVARTVDHAGIRRALHAAGAVKVHGPFATVTHDVARPENPVDEETSPLVGWREWALHQSLNELQFERLDHKVCEALEALT
jgi:exonuclease SbcD